MIKFRILFIFLICCSLSCASRQDQNTHKQIGLNKHNNAKVSTSSFIQLFRGTKQIVQIVEYEHKSGEEKKAQVIFQKTGQNKVSVSVLSLFGMEIMSLEFSGNKILKKSGLPGLKVTYFDRVMSDMLVIYSSVESLRKILSKNLLAKDGLASRSIFLNNKKLISIKYSDGLVWPKQVEFVQHDLDYKLNIKTVSVKNESLH
mgnify:CR=1 FL=1